MNFKREFLSSPEYKKFKRKLGRDDALDYIFKAWIPFEAARRREEIISFSDAEDVAIQMDAPEGLSGEKLIEAFLYADIWREHGEGTLLFSSPLWEEHNAGLISQWENGRKGGRKPKGKEPDKVERNGTEPNRTQHKATKDNQTEETEDNGTELKGWVSPRLSHGKPTVDDGRSGLPDLPF